MRIIRIALKDLSIRLRDRNTLLMMLFMPITLVAIIGFALGGVAGGGISTVEFLLVAPAEEEEHLFMENEGELLTGAAANLMSQIEMFDAEVATEEEARAAVGAGEKAGAILIPPGFLRAVFDTATVEVTVLRDPVSRIKAGIVQSLAERLATYASAGGVAGRGVFDAIEAERELTDSERWKLGGWMFQWMSERWREPAIGIESSDVEEDEINVYAYFMPAFAVLFLLFTTVASGKSIHEERESGTYERLMTAPVSRTTFIAGKLAGSYLLATVQILVLIGLGTLLFRIGWGTNPLAVVVMAVVTAAGASSLGLLVASFTRTARQTDSIGTAFVLVMSLLGGSMWPVEQAPPAFQSVARFTFNYWAHSGFKKLAFADAGLAGISQEIGIVLAMSAVFFALSVALLSRR
jgi:ABC-2 type transport system permease protein